MATVEVRIERDDTNPTVVDVILVNSKGVELRLALSNLEEGQGDDASLLRVVTGTLELGDGSIDEAVQIAVNATLATIGGSDG